LAFSSSSWGKWHVIVLSRELWDEVGDHHSTDQGEMARASMKVLRKHAYSVQHKMMKESMEELKRTQHDRLVWRQQNVAQKFDAKEESAQQLRIMHVKDDVSKEHDKDIPRKIPWNSTA
jgi:hypothetical protein